MAGIDWKFQDADRVLAASVDCSRDGLLESGKRGWYRVTDYIPWRLSWRLQVRCSIVELKENYKLPLPNVGCREFIFDPTYSGRLTVEDQLLSLAFRMPDCLDPPTRTGKSFIWQGPILLASKPFHCQVKLVIHDPKDGTYLRRVAATPERVGGIQIVSSGMKRESVVALVSDSESGRGRHERIVAKIAEGQPERVKGNGTIYIKAYLEAANFVDSNPRIPE